MNHRKNIGVYPCKIDVSKVRDTLTFLCIKRAGDLIKKRELYLPDGFSFQMEQAIATYMREKFVEEIGVEQLLNWINWHHKESFDIFLVFHGENLLKEFIEEMKKDVRTKYINFPARYNDLLLDRITPGAFPILRSVLYFNCPKMTDHLIQTSTFWRRGFYNILKDVGITDERKEKITDYYLQEKLSDGEKEKLLGLLPESILDKYLERSNAYDVIYPPVNIISIFRSAERIHKYTASRTSNTTMFYKFCVTEILSETIPIEQWIPKEWGSTPILYHKIYNNEVCEEDTSFLRENILHILGTDIFARWFNKEILKFGMCSMDEKEEDKDGEDYFIDRSHVKISYSDVMALNNLDWLG